MLTLKRNKKDRVALFKEFMMGYATDEMVDWLAKNQFFAAPASTKYHGNYFGGLFDHSYEVAKSLVDMTEKLQLQWQNARSPYIVGMFHDLCKCDAYCDVDGHYDYNKNTLLSGHGEKSIMLLSQFMPLTEEEILCIRYHMGAYYTQDWDGFEKSITKYPTVLYTHTADMYASKVTGI